MITALILLPYKIEVQASMLFTNAIFSLSTSITVKHKISRKSENSYFSCSFCIRATSGFTAQSMSCSLSLAQFSHTETDKMLEKTSIRLMSL